MAIETLRTSQIGIPQSTSTAPIRFEPSATAGRPTDARDGIPLGGVCADEIASGPRSQLDNPSLPRVPPGNEKLLNLRIQSEIENFFHADLDRSKQSTGLAVDYMQHSLVTDQDVS
jgi:hypothetical protein